MRTVSFSEPSVQNLLNRNFVNTFSNTRGNPTAGQSINHRPSDPAGFCIRGNGQQNVQTIFMTPEGEIFHVATGFLSADDLIDEANFALTLFDDMKQNRDSNNASLVAQSHRNRLKQLGFDDSDINDVSGMSRIMKMANNLGSGSRVPMGGRQSGNLVPGGDVFQPFIERQIIGDHQFSIKYPLITGAQLEQDPAKLVGNGQSFFASSSSGN